MYTVVVVLPDSSLEMGAMRNSAEIQQSSHATGLGREIKEVEPKMERRRGSDGGQSKRR